MVPERADVRAIVYCKQNRKVKMGKSGKESDGVKVEETNPECFVAFRAYSSGSLRMYSYTSLLSLKPLLLGDGEEMGARHGRAVVGWIATLTILQFRMFKTISCRALLTVK